MHQMTGLSSLLSLTTGLQNLLEERCSPTTGWLPETFQAENEPGNILIPSSRFITKPDPPVKQYPPESAALHRLLFSI